MGLLSPGYADRERVRQYEFQSYINVARAVLRHRLDQGLSQDELGKAAGTKQSRISEIEAMQGNPRLDTLDRVARVLDLAIDLVPRPPVQQALRTLRQYGEPLRAEGMAYSGGEARVTTQAPITVAPATLEASYG